MPNGDPQSRKKTWAEVARQLEFAPVAPALDTAPTPPLPSAPAPTVPETEPGADFWVPPKPALQLWAPEKVWQFDDFPDRVFSWREGDEQWYERPKDNAEATFEVSADLRGVDKEGLDDYDI